jgi:hypothetical protein
MHNKKLRKGALLCNLIRLYNHTWVGGPIEAENRRTLGPIPFEFGAECQGCVTDTKGRTRWIR